MSRSLVIAKHEYLTSITRWEFILLTLGLPLLGLVVAATAALPALLMARTVPTHLTVGVVDETGLFDFPKEVAGKKLPGAAGRLAPPQTGYTLRRYATRETAVAGLRGKAVSAYLVIPKDYVTSGEVLTESALETGLFSDQSLPPLRGTLVRGLLKDRAEQAIVDRVLDPVNIRRVTTGPGKPKRRGPLADMGRFLVPYGFTVLMMMSIFGASGYLLRGISDEKEGRIIEIVLSSVTAQDLFLGKLKGVDDPEKKRKIIGATFIDVFDAEAKKVGDAEFLAQGTLYPDVIESVSFTGGPSVTIKSHHNVGGLPERMNMALVEPLRELFKDEVRALGRELGLPDAFVGRHPFPGPGLAIRVPGAITHDKLDILRKADVIYLDEIRNAGLYDTIWQAFAVLLPVQTVGVMGDARTYDYVCALRAVTSTDGMTADYYPFDHEFLGRTANRIINEVKGINRVVYDVTSKPPGTIEWE